MEQSSYNFHIDEINKLMDENFVLTDQNNTWSKDRLASVKLLSEVFNTYIDLAEITMNFTELNKLTEDTQKNLEVNLFKNLLFIFKIIQDKDLSVSTLSESFKTRNNSNAGTL